MLRYYESVEFLQIRLYTLPAVITAKTKTAQGLCMFSLNITDKNSGNF